MRNHSTVGAIALSLSALWVCGCQSAPTSAADAPRRAASEEDAPRPDERDGAAAPIAQPGQEDIWSYVAARYDADGDGRVTADEYDRESFGRLDRDGDGVVSAEDFGARQTPAAERMMGGISSEAMLAWYFQDDDDPSSLDAGELERVLRGYDTDDNGFIDKEEFGCAAEAQAAFGQEPGGRMGRMLRETDPWEGLTRGIDQDQDGTLGDGELFAFFEQQDEDADGALAFETSVGPAARGAGGGPAGGDPGDNGDAGSSGGSGVPAGDWAPDFDLPRDHGEGRVKLSSFRGDRPVALIFGSYT